MRICYGEFYRDERSFAVADRLGIDMVHVELAKGDVLTVPPVN